MRVLIVDDDAQVRGLLQRLMEPAGIDSFALGEAEEALRLLEGGEAHFDLILLDHLMPRMSGIELLTRLREQGNETPVILVTAVGSEQNVVHAFDRGADDYVTKPFSSEELLARIQAVVRRAQWMPVLEYGDLRLLLGRRIALRNRRRMDLTPMEYDLLVYLAQAKGRIVPKSELLEHVWGVTFDPGTKVVEVQIARLRRKLARHGPPVIETVVGGGYRLAALPHASDAPA